MQTTLSFPSGILWRSIVKQKTKETFCFAKGWTQYNTLRSCYCFDSARRWLDGSGSNLFCRDTGTIRGRSIFFFSFCFFTSFKNQDIYFKKIPNGAGLERVFYTGYCDVRHNTWISIERQSKDRSEKSVLLLFRLIR